jgi:hypothetical protein
MKDYYWDYDKYKFHLFIGNDSTRWDDEGVLQPIKLYVNGYKLIDNNWGIEHNFDFITRKKNGGDISDPDATIELWENGLSFSTSDDLNSPKVIIYGSEYKEFMNWIKSCLSTKEERIKIKLEKLMNKKREA